MEMAGIIRSTAMVQRLDSLDQCADSKVPRFKGRTLYQTPPFFATIDDNYYRASEALADRFRQAIEGRHPRTWRGMLPESDTRSHSNLETLSIYHNPFTAHSANLARVACS